MRALIFLQILLANFLFLLYAKIPHAIHQIQYDLHIYIIYMYIKTMADSSSSSLSFYTYSLTFLYAKKTRVTAHICTPHITIIHPHKKPQTIFFHIAKYRANTNIQKNAKISYMFIYMEGVYTYICIYFKYFKIKPMRYFVAQPCTIKLH